VHDKLSRTIAVTPNEVITSKAEGGIDFLTDRQAHSRRRLEHRDKRGTRGEGNFRFRCMVRYHFFKLIDDIVEVLNQTHYFPILYHDPAPPLRPNSCAVLYPVTIMVSLGNS
jgi:hypothetical protein